MFFYSTETNCKSWNGQRHVKCPNGDTCFKESTFNPTIDCSDTNPPTSECRTADDHEGWRCQNGFCIIKKHVCDNKPDCSDGSDETLGCETFPKTMCNSWFGFEHVKCVVEGIYRSVKNKFN